MGRVYSLGLSPAETRRLKAVADRYMSLGPWMPDAVVFLPEPDGEVHLVPIGAELSRRFAFALAKRERFGSVSELLDLAVVEWAQYCDLTPECPSGSAGGDTLQDIH